VVPKALHACTPGEMARKELFFMRGSHIPLTGAVLLR